MSFPALLKCTMVTVSALSHRLLFQHTDRSLTVIIIEIRYLSQYNDIDHKFLYMRLTIRVLLLPHRVNKCSCFRLNRYLLMLSAPCSDALTVAIVHLSKVRGK